MTATTPSLFPASVGRPPVPQPEPTRCDLTLAVVAASSPGRETVYVVVNPDEEGDVRIAAGHDGLILALASSVRIPAELVAALRAGLRDLSR
jgi:hypothetical protein